jgi:hypothetical protein
MGAGQSQSKSPDERANMALSQRVVNIATNFIVKQQFQDMMKLRDPNYCNELVVLTSKILNSQLSSFEIEYLAQRTEAGIEVNKTEKADVRMIKKDDLAKLDAPRGKKQRLCNGVAAFFVKVASIFAAIVTTINPVYTFKDATGTTIQVGLQEKYMIPDGAKASVKRLNLCNQRLQSLMGNKGLAENKETKTINVNPNVCQFRSQNAKLEDEPGIPEFDMLYYDTFNFETGKFDSRSPAMEKKYRADLALFYKTFTGNSNMPSSIISFADIDLRSFSGEPGCQSPPNNQFLKNYEGSTSDKVFQSYAKHLQTMAKNMRVNQNELLKILDELFAYDKDSDSGLQVITLHPGLTQAKLAEINQATIDAIKNVYITCEKDYTEGIQLYEAIVQSKLLEQAYAQLTSLENEKYAMLRNLSLTQLKID